MPYITDVTLTPPAVQKKIYTKKKLTHSNFETENLPPNT